MTFATNVICTGRQCRSNIAIQRSVPQFLTVLVAYRVWSINRKHLSFRVRKLRPILLIIVESGAFYSATLLALLILYNVDSWFQYVVLDAVSPIVVSLFPYLYPVASYLITDFIGNCVYRNYASHYHGNQLGGRRDSPSRVRRHTNVAYADRWQPES